MTQSKIRTLRADDLYRFQLITDCQISPDGAQIAYTLQRVDRRTERKYTNFWIASTVRGQPRQFTYGDQVDSQPRWSPDGRSIAFLSNRKDATQFQLYIIPIDGGEARPLTDMKGNFGTFAWSPDGRQLAVQFRKKDAATLAREADEQKKKLGVVERHITSLDYKSDGAGYLPQERWHIWLIDARTGRATQLTDDNRYHDGSPCWSPDGKQLAFISNRSPDPDLNPFALELWVIPASGGEARKIGTPPGLKSSPCFSPDGKWIAYRAQEGDRQFWGNVGLWVVPADGSGEARNLTAPHDVNLSEVTSCDLASSLPHNRLIWSPDGTQLYFQVTRHGNVTFHSINIGETTDELTTIIDGPGMVGTHSLDAACRKIAYVHVPSDGPGQLFVCDLSSGRTRKVTRYNENWLRTRTLGQAEEIWFKGPDDNDLHGWILKPPGFDAAKKYPSILYIHGGPQTQYGNVIMHEFQFLAAYGYVVYYCNPRGSQGYGDAHVDAIQNRWGTVDYADIMAWADFMEKLPYIDSERMGVTGGSYGGFMTNWIIGHTDRFKAAVTQRSVSNLVSFYGSSDVGVVFQCWYGDEAPWENPPSWREQSPLSHLHNAKTPTLVIHSEQDIRVAQEQSEQVFATLRKLGVDTELVLFPEESHGLSRDGRTDRRVARLEHILRWFERYLK